MYCNHCLALLTALALVSTAEAQSERMPTFAEVEQYVRAQFVPTYEYQEGDLITKSDVQPVLAGLSSIGWQMQRPDVILALLLDDNDFLVQQLNSRKGKKLYDRVAKYPGALDRLDRMREMEGGEKTFEVFVQKTPNNYEWIETMSTTKRGKKFAEDIAKFKGGKDFNTPTGRIYRAAELIPVLRKMYDWEMGQKRRE